MIRPAELRKDWVWVRPLLERCKAKTNEGWLCEDVYSAVDGKRAAMFVSDDPQGVMVVYQGEETWSGNKVLHLWVLACDDLSVVESEGYALLDKLKASTGATKLVMDSPRKGWQKRGWKVARYIYER